MTEDRKFRGADDVLRSRAAHADYLERCAAEWERAPIWPFGTTKAEQERRAIANQEQARRLRLKAARIRAGEDE